MSMKVFERIGPVLTEVAARHGFRPVYAESDDMSVDSEVDFRDGDGQRSSISVQFCGSELGVNEMGYEVEAKDGWSLASFEWMRTHGYVALVDVKEKLAPLLEQAFAKAERRLDVGDPVYQERNRVFGSPLIESVLESVADEAGVAAAPAWRGGEEGVLLTSGDREAFVGFGGFRFRIGDVEQSVGHPEGRVERLRQMLRDVGLIDAHPRPGI